MGHHNFNKNHDIINFLQLGDGPALRGLVDDLINRYNAGAKEPMKGVACIPLDTEERIAFEKQDGTYTLIGTGFGKNQRGSASQVIQCITEVLPMEDWDSALKYAETPSLQWLFTDMSGSAAISPKGDVLAQPKSFPGWIGAFLYARYQSGLHGVTIISCENIPSNGELLQAAVLSLIHEWKLDERFIHWLETENRFISSRVIRDSRVMRLEKEEENNTPQFAIVAEGFYRWWIQTDSLPAWLEELRRQTGRISPVSEWTQYHAYEHLWQTIRLSLGILSSAFQLPGLSTAIQDVDIRSFLAHLATGELAGLEGNSRKEELNTIAESFERLENIYYEAVEPYQPEEGIAIFRSLMLPCIMNHQQNGKHPKLLITLFGLMLMDMIMYRNEKRLHTLSCDMEPEALAYAILSDADLWQKSLRDQEDLENALIETFRDLQLLGAHETINKALQ